jgi:acetyltransferase-like isoleucine patch superfamily enzyme
MIQVIKDYYWARRLAKHDCKLATGLSNLGKAVFLQLEEHVKLGKIEIHNGNYSFGAYTYMRSGGELYGDTAVGRFCSIGKNVIIGLEKNKHPTNWLSTSLFSKQIENKYQSITANNTTIIGNDCWIGQDAVIMSGVNIGNGAIIGARALVTSDVPPFAIYAGIPAKLIRYRFPAELIEKIIETHWWNISVSYLEKLKINQPESCINEIRNFGTNITANYQKIRITKNGIKLLAA